MKKTSFIWLCLFILIFFSVHAEKNSKFHIDSNIDTTDHLIAEEPKTSTPLDAPNIDEDSLSDEADLLSPPDEDQANEDSNEPPDKENDDDDETEVDLNQVSTLENQSDENLPLSTENEETTLIEENPDISPIANIEDETALQSDDEELNNENEAIADIEETSNNSEDELVLENEETTTEVIIEREKITEIIEEELPQEFLPETTIISEKITEILQEDQIPSSEYSLPTDVVLENSDPISTPEQEEQVDDEVAVIREEWFPREPTPPPSPLDEDYVLIPDTKGLLLAGSEDDLSYVDLNDVEGLEVIGLDIPGGFENLKKEIEPLFIDKDLTRKDISNIKNSIITYYKRYNMPVIAVQIPEQDITSGVLTLIITEGKLGEIFTVGNKWTKSSRIKKYIELKQGKPINEKYLRDDINFINRNPFRRVDAIYAPGEESGTTDIELRTYDRFPLRVYVGAENTGIKKIGRNRFIGGFNWNNAFAIDSILSYQYSASFDSPHKFQAHTGQYTIFLPWKNILTLFGGWALVHATYVEPNNLKNRGESAQGSFRYNIPFFKSENTENDFRFGFDFKRTNNNLDFVEFGYRMVNYVNLTQAVFGYYTKYEKNYYRSTLDLALNWSFGRWLPDQQNYKYNQLRHSAKNKYVYGKAVWNNIWRFPHDIMFYFKATGQLSNRNLLPSEELGIGGLYTVRGYYERELNGDNGLILNTELHSPTINIIRQHEPNKSKDGLQFLIFFDYGLDTVKHQQVNESKTQFLYGYGPGARFVIDPYVEARLDLGFKGERKQEYKGGSHLWHFTVTVSY